MSDVESTIIVGRVYERKKPVTVTVQQCDEIGVAFTYEGVNTFYLGHDEFLQRFELPSEGDAYDTLRAENERLKSFARRIIGTSAFEGNDLDGSYVQMLAENRELITRCIYDPERHGPSEYAEPGDDFYEFAPILCGPTLSEDAQ